MSAAQAAFEFAQGLYGRVVGGLAELRWEHVPEPVRRYIEEHPTLTAVQLVMLLVLTCPGLVIAPALGWVGLGGGGPIAGKLILGTHARGVCTNLTECSYVCDVVSVHIWSNVDLQLVPERCYGWICRWRCEWDRSRCSRGRWRHRTLVQGLNGGNFPAADSVYSREATGLQSAMICYDASICLGCGTPRR